VYIYQILIAGAS